MPSTSFSPFRSENAKKIKDKNKPYVKNVNVSLDEIARNLNTYCSDTDDLVLNETINKLDFLEKKIASIMERNELLRNALKKPQ